MIRGQPPALRSRVIGGTAAPCPSAWSPLWTGMFVPGVKIPLPLGFITPLPPEPFPEAPQRVGMGPRNQARRLSAHCPTRRRARPAIPSAGVTIGRTGKRVYIGLSERLVFLSTGSASQGEGAGEMGGGGWDSSAPAQRRRQGLWPCSVMQFGLLTVPRQHRHFPERCIWSPAMGPSVRPAPCSPIQSF